MCRFLRGEQCNQFDAPCKHIQLCEERLKETGTCTITEEDSNAHLQSDDAILG